MAASDAELVYRTREGDVHGFGTLVERHFGTVYAIAYAQMRHRETAEDLAQEVFLRAFLYLRNLQDPNCFVQWVVQVTHNLAKDWHRRRKSASRLITMVPIDDVEAEVAMAQQKEATERLVRGDAESAVQEAILNLPETERELVLLHYAEGLTKKEIAERLDVHPSTVGRQLERALKTLKQSMEPALRQSAQSLRPPKPTVARAITLVFAASALPIATKSALASAAGGSAWALSIPASAPASVATAGPVAGFLKIISTALFSGGKIMVIGKMAAIITVCSGLVAGTMHYSAISSAEPGEGASREAKATEQLDILLPPVLSLPPGEARDTLEKAEGYAALLNVEKTEELSDEVLVRNTDPRVRAAAYWTRALAYTRYNLEYRTDEFEEKRQEAVGQIKQLQPGFLDFELPTWEVAYQFNVPEPDAARVEDLVSQVRTSFADKAATDAAAAFRLGRTFELAAAFYRNAGDAAKSSAYSEEACRYMDVAAKLRPGYYEYLAYYLTVLFEAEKTAEAENLGERIANQFAGKLPYPPSGDRGPLCLYAFAVDFSDSKRYAKLLQQYAEKNPTDPWLQFVWTLSRVNANNGEMFLNNPGEAVREMTDLVQRMENGTSPIRGTDMSALASAYYKLASVKIQAEQFQEALSTYDKLAALAPHYAHLHLNRAGIYSRLATKETDPAAKQNLHQKALEEYQLQVRYNYHGTAAADAQKMIDSIGK